MVARCRWFFLFKIFFTLVAEVFYLLSFSLLFLCFLCRLSHSFDWVKRRAADKPNFHFDDRWKGEVSGWHLMTMIPPQRGEHTNNRLWSGSKEWGCGGGDEDNPVQKCLTLSLQCHWRSKTPCRHIVYAIHQLACHHHIEVSFTSCVRDKFIHRVHCPGLNSLFLCFQLGFCTQQAKKVESSKQERVTWGNINIDLE